MAASQSQNWLAVSALGVVYGDLGTSPLYTFQTIVEAVGKATPEAAIGVLSLIVWTLIVTISVKYCLIVMRADNHGEGGIMALMSLVGVNDWKRGMMVSAAMGLLGAALIYGDGIITPAISVLSALEGVNVATSSLKPYILPLAVAILLGLFTAQRFGTAKIGLAFGPIMLVWFLVIGVMGFIGVARHPIVLQAINPWHGLRLLIEHGPGAALILGGVFLCATGGEALYADMGHFGPVPIRRAWYFIVLPALLLNYAGQAGQLIEGVPKGANPFFLMAPGWTLYPLVALSTVATVIASQAIITGSFSMTRQAMQLGWLPGFDIRQTSDRVYGQIFVPVVNVLMAIGTITMTVAFRSSDKLAGAFGTAVATTMVLTTCLLFEAMRKRWRWSWPTTIAVIGLFLVIDVSFFVANLVKILDGGWIPLTLGAAIFGVMVIWRTGVDELRARLAKLAEAPESFFARLEANKVPRTKGAAVFLTRTTDKIPPFIIEYVRLIGALPETVIALHVEFEQTPRCEHEKDSTAVGLGHGLWHATLHYGFIEAPDIVGDLKKLPSVGSMIDDATVFLTSRDMSEASSKTMLGRIRHHIFSFLHRNAARISDRFVLPVGRTLEFSRHIRP